MTRLLESSIAHPVRALLAFITVAGLVSGGISGLRLYLCDWEAGDE